MGNKLRVFPGSVAIILLFFVTGCGGGSEEWDGTGLSLVVQNAKRPAGLLADEVPEPLRAEVFRVVVSGEDFAPPIEKFFPGDAESGVIDRVPAGRKRTVLVEAINSAGQVVRRRELTHIRVSHKKITPITAALLSVPFITNLRDGAVVTNSRLRILGYGEPAGSIEVRDEFNGAEIPLVDQSAQASLISPSVSTGQFSFQPGLLSPGVHRLTVRDASTGEEDSVSVRVVPPGRMPGTLLSSGGLGSSIVGLPLAASESSLGAFPEVVERMSNPGGVP